MMMRSVQLHVKMLAGHIAGFAAAMVIGAVVPSVMLAAMVLIMGHGLYKLYGKSLFRDDAALLMTLPISARDLVLGKTLAVLLWCGGMQLAAELSLLAVSGPGMAERTLTQVEDWQLAGMSPWQTGVSAGLSVIRPLLYMAVFCLLLMAMELKCCGHSGRRSPVKLILIMLFVVLIFGAVDVGLHLLPDLARLQGNVLFWTEICEDLLAGACGWYFYRSSVKMLEKEYDLG